MARFWKYHGLGNDFVIFDAGTELTFTPELARDLCNRQMGIGADGVIHFVDNSRQRVKIYNSDGSVAKICGNGLRCVVQFIYDMENRQESLVKYELETDAGIVHCEIVDGKHISIILQPPTLFPITQQEISSFQPISVQLVHGVYQVVDISVGNPHAVTIISDLNEFEKHFKDDGPALSTHSLFPDGVNSEFIQILSDCHIQVKVWERGAGPTLACGTGACASTIAGILTGVINREKECRVTLPGGDLFVRWNEDGTLRLKGPGKRVFEGIVDINSFRN